MFQTEHKFCRYCRSVVYIFAFVVLAVSVSYGQRQQFIETRLLTSNNIIGLAGNGDTVWIATERGLNYQTQLDAEKEWRGFEIDNLSNRLLGLAFGGGGAAVLLDGSNFTLWYYNHKSGKQQFRYFRFDNNFQDEKFRETALPAGGMIFYDNKFWIPFTSGGMICYNPADNKITALRPNEDEILPEDMLSSDDPNNTSVMSAAVSGDSILVTTTSKLWSYSSKNENWNEILAISDINSAQEFVSFNAVFTVENEFYTFVNVKNNGKEETAFYRNGGSSLFGGTWHKALNNMPLAIFPALGGNFFTLFEKNQVSVYADSPPQTLWEQKLNALGFRTLLADAGGDPDPQVNDILFLPNTKSAGTAGTLLVATSSGLYFSKSANPADGDYPDMTLIRYIRQVKSGESYALPGIIRGGSDGIYEKAVFVYKLKKDGRVTIRVYDYNMNHVKTVIDRARREAQRPSGRSTEPMTDFWDGTNKVGKRVSPGVYYYKITSTGGERFFGKVILAK